MSGISGVSSAINAYSNAASKISRGQGSLAANSVEMITSQNSLEANVNVIKAQDEMLGTLLDIKA